MGRVLARFALVVLAVIAGLVIVLVGSVAVDAALGRNRLDEVTNTTIPGMSGGPEVRAYVARPAGEGPFPVVIMIHEFYGLNERIVSLADGLAAEGYLVVAPDTFRGSTTAWIPRAIYQAVRSQPEDVNLDLDAVFAWISALPDASPERTAIVGFCYGGRTALAYSLHNNRLAATVIFYGSPVTDPAVLQKLPGPVLGIFGGADNSIPVNEVQDFDAALTKAGIPHEVTIYEDQPHAFIDDMDGVRAGGAQAAAWEQMLSFLEVNLKAQAAGRQPPAADYSLPVAWRYYLALAFEHAFRH